MFYLKSCLKFMLKMNIVTPLRSLFLFFFGGEPNRNGWQNRLLIVNIQALGDIVMFTSVLKHYKKRFPEKKIYLLMKDVGIADLLRPEFADEIITVDYRKFASNPFYGSFLIAGLRRIGFRTIINQDWSSAEIMGKMISVNLGAEEVIGYEGLGIEFVRPFDAQQEWNLHIVTEKLFPRFTKIIPSIDAMRGVAKKLPSAINHYARIYENATGFKEDDYSPELPGRAYERAPETLARFGLKSKQYAVLNVNSSVSFKRWPLERFVEVASVLQKRGFPIVLIGSKGELPLVSNFEKMAGGDFINLAGLTSIRELIHVVANAYVVVTNNTSCLHFATAAKTPMLVVESGALFGMFSDVGYPDIHRWAYEESKYFPDNWTSCGRGGDLSAPSLLAVEVPAVIQKLEELLSYLEKQKKIPAKKFENGYLPEASARKSGKKIVYAGIQVDYYNPRRNWSFEYVNFYSTLAEMKDISVIEFPFDPIVGMGKKYWNEKLLELVKKEKPDIFFAFMLSDEFDIETLDEIKKITKSVAWFADDQRRIHNYSKDYAPHFTLAVTTWSKAPAVYTSYGIKNVIRSQWACRAPSEQPKNLPRDIDVSFIGQRTSTRAKIISALRSAGIEVSVRGFGWPEGIASADKMGQIINRSKINLNLNDPPSPWNLRSLGQLIARRSINSYVPDLRLAANFKFWRSIAIPQIKARPFELSGQGAFVITGYADDFENYYKENEEMAFYRSIADLIEKIKYYLPKDAEREKIAAAGYARTLRDHTYEKRFRDIFRELL